MATCRQLQGSQWLLAGSCGKASLLAVVDSAAASDGNALAVTEHLLGAAGGGLAGVLGAALAGAGAGGAGARGDARSAHALCEQQGGRVSVTDSGGRIWYGDKQSAGRGG
jgi:hypothetical protein